MVLGVPAYAAADLLRPLAPALADLLEKVYYPPVAEVFLGPPDHHQASAGGSVYLIPGREEEDTRTIWSSIIFSDRAPVDHVALTTFVGGSRQPELTDLDDGHLQELVLGELGKIMNVSGAPVFSRIYRWERAIPQYNVGYQNVVDAIERFEREMPGLFIAALSCWHCSRRLCYEWQETAGRLSQS